MAFHAAVAMAATIVPTSCQMNRISSLATKSLTRRYLFALAAIATTCLISHLLVQSLLTKAQRYTHGVDIAGRQRMLSQRISKSAHQLVFASNDLQAAEYARALKADLREIQQMQNALVDKSDALRIHFIESATAQESLNAQTPLLDRLVSAADGILRASEDGSRPFEGAHTALAAMDSAASAYLQEMDKSLAVITTHSMDGIASLMRVERGIAVLTLLLLITEGLFVFRPAVHRIGKTLHGLREALSRARSATKLAESATWERNVALSTAAIDLQRLSHEIEQLLDESPRPGAERKSQRFRMLVSHLETTLGKLTDLTTDETSCDDQLVVSRISPRALLQDAIGQYEEQSEHSEHAEIQLTTDSRLPASLLIDQQLFCESLKYLMQSLTKDANPKLAMHLAYDDRKLQLKISLHAPHPTLIGPNFLMRQNPSSMPESSQKISAVGSLEVIIAKRMLERLGGQIEPLATSNGFLISIPLDENKRMTLFNDRVAAVAV